MPNQIFIDLPRRVFHAPAWDTKPIDSKKSRDGVCKLCKAIEDEGQTYGFLGRNGEALSVTINTKPYAPGHLLLILSRHIADPSKLSVEAGKTVFKLLYAVSKKLGRKYWLFANVGWVAGQSYAHLHIHVLPDPWHIATDFAEETENKHTFDPFTDTILDGIRGKKFYVRYDDAHMTGVSIAFSKNAFVQFRKVVWKMRRRFSDVRHILYQQRQSMLDRGRVPSLGYHILIINYDEPQIVLIPRVFVPKTGRWAVLELLYNADLARDLRGNAEKEFWFSAKNLAESLAYQILDQG